MWIKLFNEFCVCEDALQTAGAACGMDMRKTPKIPNTLSHTMKMEQKFLMVKYGLRWLIGFSSSQKMTTIMSVPVALVAVATEFLNYFATVLTVAVKKCQHNRSRCPLFVFCERDASDKKKRFFLPVAIIERIACGCVC